MKRGKDDLKMGPPNMAGDLIAERNELREALKEALSLLERDAPIGGRTDNFCKKVKKILK